MSQILFSHPRPMLTEVLKKQQKELLAQVRDGGRAQQVLSLQTIVSQWRKIRGCVAFSLDLWGDGLADFRAGRIA